MTVDREFPCDSCRSFDYCKENQPSSLNQARETGECLNWTDPLWDESNHSADVKSSIAPDRAMSLILNEFAEATERFGSFHSIHEGWAVVREEFLEFEEECRKKGAYDDQEDLIKEAKQLGAMAMRFLVDCCFERASDE